MQVYALGFVLLSAVFGATLLWWKHEERDEELRWLVGVALSFLVSVSLAGALVAFVLTNPFIEAVRSWPKALSLTFAFAVTLGAGRGVVELTSLLAHWCVGMKRHWGVIQSLMTFGLGAVLMGAWVTLFFLLGDESGSQLILNLSIGFGIGSGVLVVQTLGPWWTYRRARPAEIETQELSAWLAELRQSHEIPPFQVCFEQQEDANAEAHSTLLGDYVVLHKGLLGMPARLQHAIIAHEIGHLLRKDSRVQLYLTAFAVFLYVQFYPQIYRWWVLEEWLIGAVVQASFIVVFYFGLPRQVSYRAEYRADATSAELMQDSGASMIEALEELRPSVAGEATWTHPSLDDRIAALRKLQSPNLPAT